MKRQPGKAPCRSFWLAVLAALLGACSCGRDARVSGGGTPGVLLSGTPIPSQTSSVAVLDSPLAPPSPCPPGTQLFCSPLPTPTVPPTPVPTATAYIPPPSATPAPTATRRPTQTPRPTLPPTATPTPTPTLPPYTDVPFTVVYLKEGDLWSAGPGDEGERRLSNAPEGWTVDEFAVSPDCSRVAYLVREDEIRDTVVKAVYVDDGRIEVLTGEDDPYQERTLSWLNDDQIRYIISFYHVHGREDVDHWPVFRLGSSVVYDTQSGEHTVLEGQGFAPPLASPDGRYTLICSGCAYGYELQCGCGYTVRTNETGTEWMLPREKLPWSGALGWSADGERLLFWANYRMFPQVRHELVLVDATEQVIQILTPPDQYALAVEWSPDREKIAYIQGTDRTEEDPMAPVRNLSLWLSDGEGLDPRPVPVSLGGKEAARLEWSPDGQALAFLRCDLPVYPHWAAGCELWLTTRDGAAPRIVFPTLGDRGVTKVRWSPDGQTLAVTLCRMEESQGQGQDCLVGVVDRDAGSPRLLLHEPPFDEPMELEWLPDSSRLLLFGGAVWSVGADGTDLRPIVYDVRLPQLLCTSQASSAP